ncbi:MAG TPA: superoxide dismutase [Ni] [bacterium]|nr:superoxide dismutase [Ni] [bacterium]HPN45917.1 superoxide dismutase [Ni] [bacterium]
MKKYGLLAIVLLMTGLTGSSALYAHCEIPCGIYQDQLRIEMIREHITTVEKSMNEITRLAGETPVNYNQLVRWIDNKETHADYIQEIVAQYFLTQRIKPEQENYTAKLAVLHQMLVSAMKCKQSLDLANIAALREQTDKFVALYFSAAEQEHLKEHK